MPTEFGSGFDMQLLGEVMNDWMVRGLMQTAYMQTDDVARVLFDTYVAALPYPEVNFEHVLLRSPSAVVGSVSTALEAAESANSSGFLIERQVCEKFGALSSSNAKSST